MEHTHHTHTHSHTHTLQHKHTENRLLCYSHTYTSQVGEVTHKHLSKDIHVKWPKNLQRLPVPNPTTHMSRKPERRTKFKVEYPWASLPIIKESPTPRLKLTQLFPYKKGPRGASPNGIPDLVNLYPEPSLLPGCRKNSNSLSHWAAAKDELCSFARVLDRGLEPGQADSAGSVCQRVKSWKHYQSWLKRNHPALKSFY